MKHHEETIAAFVQLVKDADVVHGVAVVGSVARGSERADSDVDVYVVVTEAEFERARAAGRLSYTDHDVATYVGGYVDVKVVGPRWLAVAPSYADEPTRASLVGARVVWSRYPELQQTLDMIASPPESAWWEHNERTFTAQLRLYGAYFLPQGVARNDPFLAHWAAVQLVLASGRAVLAHARVLFAGPKYLRRALLDLPEVPQGHVANCERLLERPDPDLALDIITTVEELLASSLSPEATLGTFVAEVELAWLWGAPAVLRSEG